MCLLVPECPEGPHLQALAEMCMLLELLFTLVAVVLC